jgi:vang-like
VLDQYYTTFPIYNPYLDQLPVKGRRDNYKYYDVDGLASYGNYGNYGHHNDSRVSSPAFRSGKKEFGHNDLFYEEYEYERRSVSQLIASSGVLHRLSVLRVLVGRRQSVNF